MVGECVWFGVLLPPCVFDFVLLGEVVFLDFWVVFCLHFYLFLSTPHEMHLWCFEGR